MCSKLIPKSVIKKHLEKGNIKRKQGISLTTNPKMVYESDKGDNFFKYRYNIRLDKNDPYLYADDKFNNMLENYNKTFDLKGRTFKWFFYNDSLDYISVSEWDNKLCEFTDGSIIRI
ncbi:hypothetical protein ACSVC9_07360 [Clostridium sp. LBM24168]